MARDLSSSAPTGVYWTGVYHMDLVALLVIIYVTDFLICRHRYRSVVLEHDNGADHPMFLWYLWFEKYIQLFVLYPILIKGIYRIFFCYRGDDDEERRQLPRRFIRLLNLVTRLATTTIVLFTVRQAQRRWIAEVTSVTSSSDGSEICFTPTNTDAGLTCHADIVVNYSVDDTIIINNNTNSSSNTYYDNYSLSNTLKQYIRSITYLEMVVALLVIYIVILNHSILYYRWYDWFHGLQDRSTQHPTTPGSAVAGRIGRLFARKQPEEVSLLNGRFGDDVGYRIYQFMLELEMVERHDQRIIHHALYQDESYRFIQFWSTAPYLINPGIAFINTFFDDDDNHHPTRRFPYYSDSRQVWAHVWKSHPSALRLVTQFAQQHHHNIIRDHHRPTSLLFTLKTAIVLMQGSVYTFIRREVPYKIFSKTRVHRHGDDGPPDTIVQTYLYRQTEDALNGFKVTLSMVQDVVTTTSGPYFSNPTTMDYLHDTIDTMLNDPHRTMNDNTLSMVQRIRFVRTMRMVLNDIMNRGLQGSATIQISFGFDSTGSRMYYTREERNELEYDDDDDDDDSDKTVVPSLQSLVRSVKWKGWCGKNDGTAADPASTAELRSDVHGVTYLVKIRVGIPPHNSFE